MRYTVITRGHGSVRTKQMTYEQGDFVKAEFRDAKSGQAEWMWVKVASSDDELRIVFGTLDNEPIVSSELRLGSELAVSYDNIREHLKPSAFNQ